MVEHLVIVSASCLGFFLSFHIWHKKGKQEKLVCVIGDDCDKVVHSSYAVTFGIHNEVIGMVYYGLMFLAHVLLLSTLWNPQPVLVLFLDVASSAAALFSLFLIGVQAFILKEWCEWCIGSAALSLLIAVATWVF